MVKKALEFFFGSGPEVGRRGGTSAGSILIITAIRRLSPFSHRLAADRTIPRLCSRWNSIDTKAPAVRIGHREVKQVGAVGNSGNTTEPHLHIHAEKDEEGIPIRFDGRFLVRNNLVR